jgi:hypothetical protein
MARTWEKTNTYSAFMGKSRSKRTLGRPTHREEDNIKMDIKEIGCEGKDCITLVQDRDKWQAVANMARNFRFHKMQNTLLTEELLASEELPMELLSLSVSYVKHISQVT